MTLILTAAAAVEPVSLSEAKAFLRVAHNEEDQLISDLLRASREIIEAWTDLALITQSWRETLDRWPAHRISACGRAVRLARRPLVSVDALRVYDRGGSVQLVDPAEYRTEAGDPGRLVASLPFSLPAAERPSSGIEIDFTAGFGANPGDVPVPLREAILHHTAARYGGVEPAQTAQRGNADLPERVAGLIAPWRRARL